MTREEAKEILSIWLSNGKRGLSKDGEKLGYIEGWFHQSDVKAFEMAIKALSADPCEDYISRQEAINKMQELEDEDIKAYGCEIPEGFDGKRAIEALKTLQPVAPKSNTDKLVQMRDATPEERESIGKYINSMGKLTGVNFENLEQESEDKE